MNTVCFVKYDAPIRIYKQAKALKETKKYRLLLLCEKCDYNLLEDVFDEIIFYGFLKNRNNNFISRSFNYGSNKILNYGEKNLKRIVNNIDVDIFHTHAEPNNIPRIVIENSSKPVVFDGQDFTGIVSGIENLDKKTRDDEKYCFEHADGIVRKGPPFEINYYRQHGYKINCPETQWMGYCDEDLFADMNVIKLSDEDGEIHLVFTGSISTDPNYRYKYFISLIKELAKQKIHFHIYPAPLEYKISKEYLELDQKEKYFHFHKPVPYKDLSKEIAKYDWGIIDASVMLPATFESKRWTIERRMTTLANKLFSYMEAGIPIIVAKMLVAMKAIVEENQIGFSIDNNEINKFGELIKDYDYLELKKNVRKTRDVLSLRNQVEYLEEFYQKVIDNYSTTKI